MSKTKHEYEYLKNWDLLRIDLGRVVPLGRKKSKSLGYESYKLLNKGPHYVLCTVSKYFFRCLMNSCIPSADLYSIVHY